MKTHQIFLIVALLPSAVSAQDTKYPPEPEQIPAPDCFANNEGPAQRSCSEPELQAWREDLKHWRAERRLRVGFDASEYDRPELKWAQSSFVQPQVMMEDRYLYDPVARRYTVDRYLDDVERRYGGVDSVLLWHTYPNIGVDSRNQHDLLADLPGGLAGVKGMIADFHKRGVRVLFPIMMWDQGTRPEGAPDWKATARDMAEVGADGINGDTLFGIARTFRTASDAAGRPLVLEPEDGPSDEALAWNNLSWGYWDFPWAPKISRFKWLETRHLVHVCERWRKDKTENLQAAFFNGVGYESWENVWGIWNGITPRDAQALRRVAAIERTFPDLLTSADWEPHARMLQFGAFASRWPGSGRTLWTIMNHNHYGLSGAQLEVPRQDGWRYFDLWHGVELTPGKAGDGEVSLSFELEPDGFGAVLALSQPPDSKARDLLSRMRELSKKPLASFSHEWKALPQTLVPIKATKAAASAPAGMVLVPGGDFDFKVSGVEIESNGDELGPDVQYPWEDSPRRHHRHSLHIDAFFMDQYPVSNAQFKEFLDATHYRPADEHNFLKHWKDGTYPAGSANAPVVWVSLEDARAYAAWAGKRLPHEWEWQYAAQGGGARLYPWGDEWKEDAVPVPDTGREMRLPTDSSAHPSGASPFGVMDLVGNVWQWTDEYRDEHTRAAVLRGGSFYKPQGSMWYFPQAYKNIEHGKLLLLAPGKDRSGAIGLRCVKDAAAAAKPI